MNNNNNVLTYCEVLTRVNTSIKVKSQYCVLGCTKQKSGILSEMFSNDKSLNFN